MSLWTDIIDPATLTGYARRSLEEYELEKGTLARFLPNREVADTVVRFVAGSNGLVAEANFRAYDAPPELGKAQPKKRTILELPALGQNEPLSEYEQLRVRNSGDEVIEKSILAATKRVVQAVADRIERLRGTVLNTGIATIPELAAADDFGRSASHNVAAPVYWSDDEADRMAFLESLVDIYRETNGDEPGALLMPNRAFRALTSGKQFRTLLVGGGSRPAVDSEVRAIVSGAGLPDIVRYDRRTKSGKVLDDTRILLLPAPVGTEDWESTQLGATFWGQTLTSTDERYGIEESEQPGIVAGVYRGDKPPLIAEVISDAIGMPVLANANLSLSAKVLAG